MCQHFAPLKNRRKALLIAQDWDSFIRSHPQNFFSFLATKQCKRGIMD